MSMAFNIIKPCLLIVNQVVWPGLLCCEAASAADYFGLYYYTLWLTALNSPRDVDANGVATVSSALNPSECTCMGRR